MHRSYQSVLPCQNKLLQSRWDRHNYDEHRKKVRSAHSTVDTRAPRTYMHLHLKMKKLQLEEERLSTVERDNRLLLDKMSYIMRTEGRIDNKNDYEYKSLNREKRQRELLRITNENQSVLKRIMLRQPEYDHFKWQEDWEENQRYLDNISHYPKEWWLMPEFQCRRRDPMTRDGKTTSRSEGKTSSRSESRQSRTSQRSNTSHRSTTSQRSDRKEKKKSKETEEDEQQKEKKGEKEKAEN